MSHFRYAGISWILILGVALGCADERASEAPAVSDTASGPVPADTGSTSTWAGLTVIEKNRIGPRLQQLGSRENSGTAPVEPVGTRDGSPIYSITIRSNNPQALRDAGLSLTSVQGEIVTARFTLLDIRRAARVEGVEAIRAAQDVQYQ